MTDLKRPPSLRTINSTAILLKPVTEKQDETLSFGAEGPDALEGPVKSLSMF